MNYAYMYYIRTMELIFLKFRDSRENLYFAKSAQIYSKQLSQENFLLITNSKFNNKRRDNRVHAQTKKLTTLLIIFNLSNHITMKIKRMI